MIAKTKTDKCDHFDWDDKLPGFGIRTRNGRRTYVVQYRIGKQQRRVTIGSAEKLTLDQARKEAKKVFGKVAAGADPQGDKKAGLAAAAATDTFEAVAKRFVEHQERHRREATVYSTRLYLLTHAKRLHGLKIDTVTRTNIASVLSDIASHSGAVSADRARSAMSAMFGWAIGEGQLGDRATNPVEYTNVHGTVARDRVLTSEEIAAIWSTLPDNDYGNIVKLLFYTGCRPDEIGWLLWREVDLEGRAVNFESERIKNKKPFYLPLSDAALRLLNSIEREAEKDDDGNIVRERVFGKGKGGFQGWSIQKSELDAKLNFEKPWQLRDIRRTVATRMAESGIEPHIVEACLNHVSGFKAGVAGVYNRAAYAEPKREALNKWAKEIATILLPNRKRREV